MFIPLNHSSGAERFPAGSAYLSHYTTRSALTSRILIKKLPGIFFFPDIFLYFSLAICPDQAHNEKTKDSFNFIR